ncbi:MAG TPA: glycolate oxidase subunit GlcF [Burkholderiales bacterium]|jgi:glycolate oxidase iron-sulfur subunit|nr:glycolate oxidase subunit GlcF [Burkholderiales bacterium]
MQTNLAPFIRDTAEGKEAEAILRKCTHCGMCTATCPTYQLLNDELDGPRGRIYLIKQVLEGSAPGPRTQLHLDRCLTCRSCETTCPTGVRYGRLLEIGRPIVEKQVGRTPAESARRKLLRTVIPSRRIFNPLLALAQLALPLLPQELQRKVPPPAAAGKPWPAARHARKVLLLESCAQANVSPATNAAAARVLDRVGITLVRVPKGGCCGAVSLHLSAQEEALGYMRRNIDAWWPRIEVGAEAIVSTASGCGVTVKDYGHLLARDPAYADKAKRISALAKDVSEVIAAQKDKLVAGRASPVTSKQSVAFHSPCSLQHGMKLQGQVEALLTALGYALTPVPDAHLCCGSAGTYSILQPELSKRLLANKIAALESGKPAAILTANIGCQMHLQSATNLPVRHWIEALDDALTR